MSEGLSGALNGYFKINKYFQYVTQERGCQGLENTLIPPGSRPDERKRRACLLQGKKKDSGALSARRSLRKILGGGLLSHMKICSIIGDKELNFRVRNGIGCTLFSMATKKFW